MAGTRFGRQELEGVLLEDVEGALWPRDADRGVAGGGAGGGRGGDGVTAGGDRGRSAGGGGGQCVTAGGS